MEKLKAKYINITGNVGSGTTSLCQRLCEYFGWTPSYSQAHTSPFLKTFYQNGGRFAFQNQVYIILQSLEQQRDLDWSKGIVCQDYTIYEHNAVYSKAMLGLAYIDSTEFALLEKLFESLSEHLKKPDLLIYLRTDVETLASRVKGRNRDIERNIYKTYIDDLQRTYSKFVAEWDICPCIEIDTTNLNLGSDRGIRDVVVMISQHLKR